MPNKRTFEIKPVKKLLDEEVKQYNLSKIIEPFPFESTVDVFDFLDGVEDNSVDCVLVDPPYTKRQVSEHYKQNNIKISGWHTSAGWTAKVRRLCADKLKVGGKAITFGYNTNGLGLKNNMRPYRILIVHHGGDHYDLLVTCEKKGAENRSITHAECCFPRPDPFS